MSQALERAAGACELCAAETELSEHVVVPRDATVAVCGTCAEQLVADPLDANHWFCLQGSAWSEHPPVQVVAWRLLGRVGEAWAIDLRDQLYLDDDTLRWAKDVPVAGPAVVDSNGTPLADGDTVILIKDLDVKGANFTAKRGTVVKNIRLGEDPGLVEGRVNKTSIYLKTEFLKKA